MKRELVFMTIMIQTTEEEARQITDLKLEFWKTIARFPTNK